jgi:excisionase family DNA binding protein
MIAALMWLLAVCLEVVPRWASVEAARHTLTTDGTKPVGRDLVRKLIREGEVRSLHIGGRRTLVDVESLHRWAERQATGGDGE